MNCVINYSENERKLICFSKKKKDLWSLQFIVSPHDKYGQVVSADLKPTDYTQIVDVERYTILFYWVIISSVRV